MRISTSSLHEELRLQELFAHQILDSPAEQEFDDLTELAAHIFGCPIAAITFIDETRQWIKAAKGIDAGSVEREDSFCTYTIQQNEVMMVQDATKDERFAQNRYVAGEPDIRFYAGAPIVSSGGFNLGALCVVDKTPRVLDARQVEMLQIISRQISKLLELRLKNIQLQAAAASALQKHQDLVHHTMMRHERENFDVSTALHEDLAQGLAATKLYLEMAEETGSPSFITKSKQNVAKMLEDARSLSKKLFPTTLKYGCIADMLQQQLTQFEKSTGISVNLICPRQKAMHPDLHIVLFRIVEEQLKNICTHAGATKVEVTISEKEELILTISDDGAGFDMPHFKAGHGLRSIASLAEYYGGRVDIHAAAKYGCVLKIYMPAMKMDGDAVAASATRLTHLEPLLAPETISYL